MVLYLQCLVLGIVISTNSINTINSGYYVHAFILFGEILYCILPCLLSTCTYRTIAGKMSSHIKRFRYQKSIKVYICKQVLTTRIITLLALMIKDLVKDAT